MIFFVFCFGNFSVFTCCYELAASDCVTIFCQNAAGYYPLVFFSGLCTCEQNFYGDDCSISMETIPLLSSLSEEVYSETGAGDVPVTRLVTVYGSGFVNTPTHMCHLTELQVCCIFLFVC